MSYPQAMVDSGGDVFLLSRFRLNHYDEVISFKYIFPFLSGVHKSNASIAILVLLRLKPPGFVTCVCQNTSKIILFIYLFLPGLCQPHRRCQSQGPGPKLWAINPGLFKQTPTNMVSNAFADKRSLFVCFFILEPLESALVFFLYTTWHWSFIPFKFEWNWFKVFIVLNASSACSLHCHRFKQKTYLHCLTSWFFCLFLCFCQGRVKGAAGEEEEGLAGAGWLWGQNERCMFVDWWFTTIIYHPNICGYGKEIILLTCFAK